MNNREMTGFVTAPFVAVIVATSILIVTNSRSSFVYPPWIPYLGFAIWTLVYSTLFELAVAVPAHVLCRRFGVRTGEAYAAIGLFTALAPFVLGFVIFHTGPSTEVLAAALTAMTGGGLAGLAFWWIAVRRPQTH